MVPQDAYCMLTVTMKDIYPYLSWNYVFGWANYKSRTGVFSFGRYDPAFNGEDQDSDTERRLLENACYVMVHEIGHMFGMLHCIYYECIMNGFNSYEE
jgi:archaemetzincin